MHNKIKIYIFHPYSSIGGADTSISRLINNLDKNIYKIDFITLGKANLKLNKKVKNKIKIIKINSSRTVLSIFKIRKYLHKDKINKYKKYIFISNQNFANIISFFILYNLEWIKHILIERNHIDEFKYNKSYKNYFIKLLIKFLYKKADKIIGISKKLSDDLADFANCKIQTIYNPAYDKEIYNLSKEKILFNKNKKIILNIGRFENQKDHITLLKAFKDSLKRIDSLLLIIGYGSEKNKIIDFINLNNLNKNVIILEKVANPYPYFKISDLFILTSLYEGFGNVLTEAIMFKIPTISTDCNSGPKEILLNGKGGDLVKVGDYKNLEKKIVINLNKKNYKKINLAYQGLKRFSIKKIVDQYNEIFKTI
jgi:glycosyltransferase involved in cell wall biosynthesis